ncbi:xanthine dehydrogenase family protein molybdopterin-binding subunit [Pseudomonas synxantha]|uniref:Xanthine dehydrogenase family protein molybdopterin-binding subunit n=1 Tax=Pseudomonas synxantha TaxID=47883 RepID=A0A5D3GBP0_9PSED|nr:molybdopterin cofactor-binding domain-containing protein [Pseudomonas synxantha]TYK57862.1 xanthine dehydrogenase family protein molybdopterin-binding subunit [Pseudomonas synxantha]
MMSVKKQKGAALSLNRRDFLVGSFGGAVIMAFAPLSGALSASAQESIENKSFAPTMWFEITNTGEVVINIAKAEMGQHVGTSLARMIADELGADWNQVSINHVDTDPKWGVMITGGSWSVSTSYRPLSQAGAAGRIALIEEAGKLLSVAPSECDTENGFVVTPKGNMSFSDVVTKGSFNRVFSKEELANMPLKSKDKYKIIGSSTKALDIPKKTNGTAEYGIDVEIDGMVYARPVLPPTRYGSEVVSIDDSEAKKLPGYLGYELLKDPSKVLQGWVSVIAKDYPTAIKAGDLIKVKYKAGPTAKVSEQDIFAEGDRQIKDVKEGLLFVNEGDVGKVFKKTPANIEATYRTHTVMHYALEPLNAVALLKDGIWHIHAGNQWPSLAVTNLASALGVDESHVVVHQYYLGGGFGRKLAGDYMLPAALTAKQIGKPVKCVFTRQDDSRFDLVRSASVSRLQASLGDKGKGGLTALDHAFSAGWPTMSTPAAMVDNIDKKGKIDPFASSGADHWYSIDNHRVRTINNGLAHRTFMPGYLRAVGPGWITWGLESFIDEVAHQLEIDPLEFRLSLLDGKGKQAGRHPESVGGASRLKNTLEVLKKNIQYGNQLPADEGIGVALSFGQERTMPTWIATAAHVKVDRTTGKIELKKISIVVDAGIIVHPDGALAQLEGGVLWGISMALYEHTEFEKGQVRDVNLNTYTPLRMNDVPEISIELVESGEMPVGLGEPGVVGVAPAIGNAVFQAVGVRLRELPMKSQHVLDSLAQG